MSRRRIILSLAALPLLGLAFAWLAGTVMMWPRNQPVAPPAPPGRVVGLVADDGVALEGSYWPGRTPHAPAVLLLHGVNSSRGPKMLWLLPGIGHAEAGAVFTDEYRRRVRALFARTLGEPGAPAE